MSSPKKNNPKSTIALNKKAKFDYFIEETFEAGLVLQGWEVKSLREGQANLTESYVLLKDGEAWLFGCQIMPLLSASSHVNPDPLRTRKLLLHEREINRLAGATQAKGYTAVTLAMYWKGNKVKLEIGLGKGKKQHDKRAVEKDREWNRQKDRLLKNH